MDFSREKSVITLHRRRFLKHQLSREGFCYLRLFIDVLGPSCNIAETKRIFGKYPRIKDVVLQLARLSVTDCFVHDVEATGKGLYHVSKYCLTRLSILVLRFMFNTDLIGGYDTSTDPVMRQAMHARKMASLVALNGRDIRSVMTNAAEINFNRELSKDDSALKEFINGSANASVKDNRKISLPFQVSATELVELQMSYPEFVIMNNSKKHHTHAVAGNSRVLSMEVMLDAIGYKKHATPIFGEDVYVVDIGGDYLCHVKNNRMNVHSDTPILTPRDSARETNRHLSLAAMVRTKKMSQTTYERLVSGEGCKQRCNLRAEHCKVTATYVIINHAEYDISREALAVAFDNHKPRMAYSALHFDPRIYTKDNFLISSLKCRVIKEEGKIKFDFVGDSSFSYQHDLNNYLSTITQNVLLTPNGRCYLVERVGQRGATLFLKYTLCDVQPECPVENSRFCFWMNNEEEMVVVTSWKFQNGYYRDSKFVRCGSNDDNGRFIRERIETSRRLYDLIMANCVRASEKGFNLSEMISAAIAFNSRLVINGQDVRTDRERLDIEALISLVVACYCMAYVSRYSAGKVVEYFVAQEKDKRNITRLGFLSMIEFVVSQLHATGDRICNKWNNFVEYLSAKKARNDMTFEVTNSVRVVTFEEYAEIVAGYGHFDGEALLQTDEGEVDLLDLNKVVELVYKDNKLTAVQKVPAQDSVKTPRAPVNSLPTLEVVNERVTGRSSDVVSVTPMVPEPSVITSSSVVSMGRASNIKIKKYTNMAVRSISRLSAEEPLSTVATKALRELRASPDSDCGSLVLTTMPGDGRCAYYAMLRQIGVSPASDVVENLRTTLYEMCPPEFKEDNKNLLSSNFKDMTAWGTTDNFGVLSVLTQSQLCVHVEMEELRSKTLAYSLCDKPVNGTMHVRWNTTNAGHVDALDPISFERDVTLRAAAMVRRIQERLFELKGSQRVNYHMLSHLPKHRFLNRAGLKFLSILASFPKLRTSGSVLDLCGAPGGFCTVLNALRADYWTVSNGAVSYTTGVPADRVICADVADISTTSKIPAKGYTLVLADGANEDSWRDNSLIVVELNLIAEHLTTGGNCVIKINNFFTQLDEMRVFFSRFASVDLFKPEFSLPGNVEVYAVCWGFKETHQELRGERKMREELLRGLLAYFSVVVKNEPKPFKQTMDRMVALITILDDKVTSEPWTTGPLNILPSPAFVHPDEGECAYTQLLGEARLVAGGGVMSSRRKNDCEQIPLLDLLSDNDESEPLCPASLAKSDSVGEGESIPMIEFAQYSAASKLNEEFEQTVFDRTGIDMSVPVVEGSLERCRMRLAREYWLEKQAARMCAISVTGTSDTLVEPSRGVLDVFTDNLVDVSDPRDDFIKFDRDEDYELTEIKVEQPRRKVCVPDNLTESTSYTSESNTTLSHVNATECVVEEVVQEIAAPSGSHVTLPASGRLDESSIMDEYMLETVVSERVEAFVTASTKYKGPIIPMNMTITERIGRFFGKAPKMCKIVPITKKTEFSLKSKSSQQLENGKSKPMKKKTKLIHNVVRTTDETSHYVSRCVGTMMDDVCVEDRSTRVRVKKAKVKTCTKGCQVDLSQVSVVPKDTRKPDVDEVSIDSGVASTLPSRSDSPVGKQVIRGCRLASVIATIDRVNIPTSEPMRATASTIAVDKIKQDILICYAWTDVDGPPTISSEFRLSPCLTRITGKKKWKKGKLDCLDFMCDLERGVTVRRVDNQEMVVLLLILPSVHTLEYAVLECTEKIGSATVGERLRVSFDALHTKYYQVDAFHLIELLNTLPALISVLYLHPHFPNGRAFASPYLYPGKHANELFPQLSDADLGLIRCPGLMDDGLMENRYRNAMIEYLHTSNFCDQVKGLELRKYYDRAITIDGEPLTSALVTLASKGIYFYDNHNSCVLSGEGEPYSWAFAPVDGINSFAQYNVETKKYDSKTRFLMYCRTTKVMISQEIYNHLSKINIMDVKIPKITWVNGPPGCGKTEFALRQHNRATADSKGDMIVTVTKESCESLRARVSKMYGDENLKRNYRTVASILHNGTQDQFDKVIIDEALMVHSGQLAFVAHLTGAKEVVLVGDIHQIPYIDRDHVTVVKYASPTVYCSVSRTLRKTYRCPIDVTYILSTKYEGFYSASEVVTSMVRRPYSGRGVEKERGVVYLTLFQNDKDTLLRQGFSSDGSKVLTVHEAQGQTFPDIRYVRTSHKPLQLYESEGHAIVAISRHTKSFVYYSDVEDRVTKWVDAARERPVTELLRWNEERKLQNGESLKGGYYAEPLLVLRPQLSSYASREATSAIQPLVPVTHNPNEPEIIDGPYVVYDLPKLQLRCPKDTDLGYLQAWYDNVIPTSACNDVSQDQLICEASDLHIAITDRLNINPLRVGCAAKAYKTLRPVIKTLMPANIVQSQIQTLLCMSKRNANAPNLRNSDLTPSVTADLLFRNFVKSCLRDDFDMDQGFDTIEFNARVLQQWLDKQLPGVAKQIASDRLLYERDFSKYNFMVKDKLKPPLEPSAAFKIPGGQTIAYHDKEINAAACPIFAKARDRLLSILKPNIQLMTGISNDGFESLINDKYNMPEIWRQTNKIENDFSKYDKSQGEELLRFEIRLYRLLGVPEELLVIWYESHRRSVLKDKTNGVNMGTSFQRKSGDAVTFLGNTVCLLAATAACYDFDHMRLGMFAGDDSLLFMEKYYNNHDATSAFADWFNLESKLLDIYTYPYFCSKFLMLVDNRLFFVPDPLKLVTKWGRSDLVNRKHAEEYRVSLADNLKSYGNVLLHMDVDAALRERYKVNYDSAKVLRIINTYVNDTELFQKLFIADDEEKLLREDSTRPSLE